MGTDDLMQFKDLDLVAFNRGAEAAFCDLVTELIIAAGGVAEIITVIQEAAFELDISPETAKRYLLKHSARRGRFVIHRRQVRLREPVDSRDQGRPGASSHDGGRHEAPGGHQDGACSDPIDALPLPAHPCACGSRRFFKGSSGPWRCLRCDEPPAGSVVLLYTLPDDGPPDKHDDPLAPHVHSGNGHGSSRQAVGRVDNAKANVVSRSVIQALWKTSQGFPQGVTAHSQQVVMAGTPTAPQSTTSGACSVALPWYTGATMATISSPPRPVATVAILPPHPCRKVIHRSCCPNGSRFSRSAGASEASRGAVGCKRLLARAIPSI